jgi:hypothetical protein
MKPFPTITIFIFWIILMSGCSPHYYHTNENGVTLYLRKAETTSVFLYTSLDGFRPDRAEHKGELWINRVPSNRDFVYFYRVDGKLYTPDCLFKEKDDFGFENCIYEP